MKSLIHIACTTMLISVVLNPAYAKPYFSKPQMHEQSTSKAPVIHLSANASTMVANDQVHATLSIETQKAQAADLVNSLTRAINQALNTAKAYPQVKTSTGQQSTYPVYDKDNRITGWQGYAQINLTSHDFAATSKLIAALQPKLQMKNLSFSLSDAQREKIETQLMQTASKKLQARAESLLTVWQAKEYKLMNLQLSSGTSYHSPPMMYAGQMRSKAVMSTPNLASGESKINITASGIIQLQH